MAGKDKAVQQAQQLMPAGETVRVAEICQIKGSGTPSAPARAAKDVAVSLTLTAATSVAGLGVMRMTVPAPMWLVVTDQRLMVFRKVGSGITPEVLVFQAPLEALHVTGKGGLLKTIVVSEAATGEPIFSVNFGVRATAWSKIVDAARR